MLYYPFGPYEEFNIRFIGEMEQHNGSYESRDTESQFLVQMLCHAIYQIKTDIQSSMIDSDQSVLYFGDIYFHWIRPTNSYAVYTRSGMTMMVIYETGFHSDDIEFFSPNQYEMYGSFLLNYAYQHVRTHGRPV